MDDLTPVGSMTIRYSLAADGDLVTWLEVEGDMPVVVQLGLLDIARHSVLHDDEGETDA